MENQYIGKLLDNRYEIIEQIGVGGMAEVYKAKCHRLNRMVAIKILKPELAQDAEFRRRFSDESQAVAMLSHPNIMAVYDVSKSAETEYIVMELIDGITLKQYMLRKGEPLNWKEALHFTTQILKGLGHAHSRGIIHRDIKPQNIMILRDGSVRVTDFGIARLVSAQQATLTQEALGSVHYISPEQARGSYIDGRSDLYSVGVVLYEMLTGRLPFEGDSPVAVAIQHINSVPLSPRDLNSEIPEALEAITMKAMAPNRNQRYSDADDMLRDLEEFRKNPNIEYEYSAADFTSKPEGDEPTQVIPVTVVKQYQGTAGEAGKRKKRTESRWAEEENFEEEEYPDKKEGRLVPLLMGLAALLVFFVGVGYFLWVTFFSGLLKPTELYTVPNLEGKTLAEVQMDPSITEVFQIQQGSVVYSEKPAGEILSQNPIGGEKREPGDLVITVEVSAGQERRKMTNLKNLEYREAYVEIEKLGLKMDESEYTTSDTVPKGHVISFTPSENTDVTPGDIVHLVISTGPEVKYVQMPDVCDMDLEQAEKEITAAGLVVGAIDYVPDMTLPGIVLEQSEAAFADIPEGSIIHLTVSLGPDGEPDPSQPPEESPGTGDLPAVNPSVAPEPTPKYKTVSVDIEDGTGTVQIVVKVDGKVEYDNAVGRNLGVVNLTIPGVGTQVVEIYLDGVLHESKIVDFSV